jgi:4-amino-4-deoxy-L-arabinose transferase
MNTVSEFFSLISLIPEEAKALLLIGFVALIFAHYLHLKQHKYELFVIVFAAFSLASSFALFDPFLHMWDESFHALVAKNAADNLLAPHLLNSPNYGYNPLLWVNNYIWLHKPPLALWQMALSIDLFGQNIYAVRFPSILAFSATTFFVYGIGRHLFNRNVAFYGAVLFVLFQFTLEQVAGLHTADHIDVSFILYITASLWAWLRFQESKKKSDLLLIGLFAGLAVLTKWLVGLLIFGAWGGYFLLLLFSNRKDAWNELTYIFLAVIVSLLTFLPWNIFAAINYPQEYWFEFNHARRHFSEVIEGHGGDMLFYWDNLSILFGSGDITSYILLLAVSSLFFMKKELKDKLVVSCFILFPYLFFTFATTKMPNFVNIVSPLILVVVAAFFISLTNRLIKRVSLSPYFSLAITPFLFIFLLRPQLTIENHNFRTETNYFADVQDFVKALNGSSADLYVYADFHHYENIVHMFYHPSTAVLDIPKNQELNRLVKEGKKIVVLYKSEYPDLKNAPEEIKVVRAKIEDQK